MLLQIRLTVLERCDVGDDRFAVQSDGAQLAMVPTAVLWRVALLIFGDVIETNEGVCALVEESLDFGDGSFLMLWL